MSAARTWSSSEERNNGAAERVNKQRAVKELVSSLAGGFGRELTGVTRSTVKRSRAVTAWVMLGAKRV